MPPLTIVLERLC